MTYVLSASAFGLMKECPRCFWLTYNGIWRRPTGIYPSLPNGMDKILKNHFDKFIEKKELPPEIKESGECADCVLFPDKIKLDEWRDIRRGLQYKDDEGNILKGMLDNVLLKNNKLIVLDYKTRGYPLKEDTHLSYQTQIDVYTFLLKKAGYITEDFGFLLFYFPDKVNETGEFVFDTKLIKMPAKPSRAEAIFRTAIEFLEGPCPDISDGCEWCQLVGSE